MITRNIQIGLPCNAEPWCGIVAWVLLAVTAVLVTGLVIAVIREIKINKK